MSPGCPAGVRQVGNRAHEGDHLPLPEDRRDDHVVRQVAGAQPGVVRDQNVPLDQGFLGNARENVARGTRQDHAEVRGAEAGLAHGVAVLVDQNAGEVAAFADDGRERCADGGVVDLVHEADQALPLDLKGDGVDGLHVQRGMSVRVGHGEDRQVLQGLLGMYPQLVVQAMIRAALTMINSELVQCTPALASAPRDQGRKVNERQAFAAIWL